MQEQSLNVVQHGLEYLKACYIPDPTDYGVQYGDVYVYQVGDIKFERTLWRRVETLGLRHHGLFRLAEEHPAADRVLFECEFLQVRRGQESFDR